MRRHRIQTVLASGLTMRQSHRLLCASRRKGDSRLLPRPPHGLYAASLCVRGHPSRRWPHQSFQRPFRLRNLPYSAQWPHSVPVKVVQVRPRFIHPHHSHQLQSPILPHPPCSSDPFDLIPNKFWQTNSASMANYPAIFICLVWNRGFTLTQQSGLWHGNESRVPIRQCSILVFLWITRALFFSNHKWSLYLDLSLFISLNIRAPRSPSH